MEMPVRHLRVLAIGLALLLGSRCAQPQAPAAVDNGKRMFASAGCAACHGSQGQGTSLAPQIGPPLLELQALIAYARQPTGKMPPVPVATASDGELAEIYAFLKSIAPRIAPPALSLAGVLRYVRAPTGQMPPYTAKVVSDQDLADIYSYLKTFPLPPPLRSIPSLNQ